MRLSEFEITKNKWELILSSSVKREIGNNLVQLVQNAYQNTPDGSFVNAISDVIPSDWHVIDHDPDDGIDATVFYRKNRPGENWVGNKIQGIGHDGQRLSKDYAIKKIQGLLSQKGWWIEASDAMEHVLKKVSAPVVNDPKKLRILFNDPDLVMVDKNNYQRTLDNGKKIQEIVFGNPQLVGE